MPKPPRVFISYSHDSNEHKDWVRGVANALLKNGVDVAIDQYDVHLGSNLARFMESGLQESDRVVMVCTDSYNSKANTGVGGVGYEANIMTAELYADQESKKIIPCIRNVEGETKTPAFMGMRRYLNMSDDGLFEERIEELLREIHNVPSPPRPPIGQCPFADESAPESGTTKTTSTPSTVIFNSRLAQSFPGVRGVEWFDDGRVATKRFSILFSPPYDFNNNPPIWWWRRGELAIDGFSVLGPDEILLGPQEFIIDRIAVYKSVAYWSQFVYVETKPSLPTNLYDPELIREQLEYRSYAKEEYALFRGMPISREEYDDGAAVIDGEVVSTVNEAELRIRYLSPYNFLIAPQGSSINNKGFDTARVELLEALLSKTAELNQLVDAVKRLPRRDWGPV